MKRVHITVAIAIAGAALVTHGVLAQKPAPRDLAALIQAIQSPPVSKIGVMDVESFFPSKDRFALAMKLNNLLAAPGFQAWLEGEQMKITVLD